MDGQLFTEGDLADLLKEMEEAMDDTELEEDEEMTASKRRYLEIIKKHKQNNE